MRTISATVTMTDDPMPEGFDQSGYAWKVRLLLEGRYLTVPFYTGSLAGEPTAASVVECLMLDAQLGQETFEDFCADLGYDTDSRRAYDSWQQCQKMAKRLTTFLRGREVKMNSDGEVWADENGNARAS